ncbi:MAG: glycosyltransferase family 4 protein [Verrucomicrobiota bacterium]
MRLGYAYSRYPVLSQTFCDAEMLELERRSHEIVLGSLYPPKTDLRHPYLRCLRAPIQYAPSSRDLDHLMRKAQRRGRWPAKLVSEHEHKYGAEYKASLRARNALFFVQLFENARVPHFHVHFANRAAHTALFVKEITGIPFSVTAHGQDFMSDLGSTELLREICAAAAFVAAETDYSRNLLARCCPESASKIIRVYNGLDLSRFPEAKLTGRTGNPLRILSVGRLVAFKGFEVLIDACAILRERGVQLTCTIIGDGALREGLLTKVSQLDLVAQFSFVGEASQDDVLAALEECDLFALASTVDERGASDVFPTVIAEAMACAKAVVSTTVAGIPELVAHGKTGLLVSPDDPRALAEAIARISSDPETLRAYGQAGRLRLEENFTIEKTIEPLLAQFQRRVPASRAI